MFYFKQSKKKKIQKQDKQLQKKSNKITPRLGCVAKMKKTLMPYPGRKVSGKEKQLDLFVIFYVIWRHDSIKVTLGQG